MQLTDQERQEIENLLERGEPLPDKYRFLLFREPREAELIWPGKTHKVTNVVLPFQSIEQIDEPRAETAASGADLFTLDRATGRQSGGWSNKLIWGDNKLVLSSLKNGPLRREIENAGGLKLVYIDPPFDVGADFSFELEVGGNEKLVKEPSVIEDIAYRDTWGKGADSFIGMIYERLILLRDLLSDSGSIYLHCDSRVSSLIRLAMDEVFGADHFINEIVWKRRTGYMGTYNKFGATTDTILWFSKSDEYVFFEQSIPNDPEYLERFKYKDEKGRLYRLDNLTSPNPRPNLKYSYKGFSLRTTDGQSRGSVWSRWTRRGDWIFLKIPQAAFSAVGLWMN